ncbi:MAG TPA: TrbG/VirB9 family P-type conjugative transfer protein [Croceibacterium sp.]|nr:TrbG/VirB9 family P-type conjugative transfer protein [Croceibacterium sp.]
MIRQIHAAALGLFACAGLAHAEDTRLVHKLFDPGAIVRIEGKPSVQATIRFGEDELIENVAIGDSNAWQVTPNKRANLLFVKPLAEKATTNMTVVTNAHTYFFDLVASPKAVNPLYELAFTYPQEAKPAARKTDTTAGTTAPTEVELAVATDPAAVVDPADLNFAWTGSGDRKLLPSRIYDDGQSTYLVWPAGKPVPAILIKNQAGTEGPVNFAVRGDVIVVDGVPRQIVLRSGRQLATIDNKGPERQSAALARLDEVKK